MNNELYITKSTNLSKIKDKDKYTKLIIQTKINPKKLKDFVNVKELVIDYVDKNGSNYNERNLNLLPFKETIEKIVFKKIEDFGLILYKSRLKDDIAYKLEGFINLKSIEFPSTIKRISRDYLENLSNLIEIIFNLNDYTYIDNYFKVDKKDSKKIILKYKEKEYSIVPEYSINFIDYLKVDTSNNLRLMYSMNSEIETYVDIDPERDNVKVETQWEICSRDREIYIPDYVTKLKGYFKYFTNKISLNLKLLDEIKKYSDLITGRALETIETIELRSNNEMTLFPSKEINIREYGMLKNISINDNLLCLDYDICKVTINSKGEILKEDKITKEGIITEEKNNKSVITEEIIDYLCYKRCLEFIKRTFKDKETKDALNVIENKVKKLIK